MIDTRENCETEKAELAEATEEIQGSGETQTINEKSGSSSAKETGVETPLTESSPSELSAEEQAAEMKDEVQRDVQFTAPPGSVPILQRLPGFADFNPVTEVLRMLRCGFGLKDTLRLWNKVLRIVLQELGLTPLQSDAQVYV